MSKSQFIYRRGLPVTVTRNDNTTYNTYMLYERANTPHGTLSDNYMLSMDFLRAGTFTPNVDIGNGYVVNVLTTNEQFFISAMQPETYFSNVHGIQCELVLLDFPIAVQVVPSQSTVNVPRDKFGTPITETSTTTANIIVTKSQLIEKPQIGGGNSEEQLEFYCMTGDIKEGDVITWNGHTYRTMSVWPFGFADVAKISQCKGQRTVDV